MEVEQRTKAAEGCRTPKAAGAKRAMPNRACATRFRRRVTLPLDLAPNFFSVADLPKVIPVNDLRVKSLHLVEKALPVSVSHDFHLGRHAGQEAPQFSRGRPAISCNRVGHDGRDDR